MLHEDGVSVVYKPMEPMRHGGHDYYDGNECTELGSLVAPVKGIN
jgi:hypothetical protein